MILPVLLSLALFAVEDQQGGAAKQLVAAPAAAETTALNDRLDAFNKKLAAQVARSRRQTFVEIDTKDGERAMRPTIKSFQARCNLYGC